MTRVMVCRVGRRPTVEQLLKGKSGHHLNALQAVCGGLVTVVSLEDGVDLWSNDEALLLGLPLNRVIPAMAPELPPGPWEFIVTVPGAAEPGTMGEWRIHGDFVLARADSDGGLADVTDADVLRYTAMFQSTDPEAAALMDHLRATILRRR